MRGKPSKTSKSKIKKLEIEEQALILRKAGFSYRNIANKLDVTPSTVFRYVEQGMSKIAKACEKEATFLRAMATEELKELKAKLWPQIVAGDVRAISEARQINESLRKLWGIDGPIKIDADIRCSEGLSEEAVLEIKEKILGIRE